MRLWVPLSARSFSLWVYLSQSNGKETKTRLNALIRDKRHKLCKWLNNRQPKNGKESQKRKNDNENRLEFGTTSSTFIPFCKVNRPFGCRTMEKTNILLRNDRQQKNGRWKNDEKTEFSFDWYQVCDDFMLSHHVISYLPSINIQWIQPRTSERHP